VHRHARCFGMMRHVCEDMCPRGEAKGQRKGFVKGDELDHSTYLSTMDDRIPCSAERNDKLEGVLAAICSSVWPGEGESQSPFDSAFSDGRYASSWNSSRESRALSSSRVSHVSPPSSPPPLRIIHQHANRLSPHLSRSLLSLGPAASAHPRR
jgi:hypothetical protein